MRGVRIQSIVRELNDEKIDVIEWNADPAIYIAEALSPARVSGVYLIEQGKTAKTATVVVPEDQLSLAIGRDGQNARLAAKLTSWRIDIKSLPEATADALHKLQSDPEYAYLAEHETETLPQISAILAKKSEGRAVTPEEYQQLTQFVDRVERGIIRQRQGIQRTQDEQTLAIRAQIPAAAFEMPLEDLPLSDKTYNLLLDAGYHRVGDLILQIKLDPDAILSLSGVGAKVMREIETILNTLEFPEAFQELAPVEVQTAPVEPSAPVAEIQPEAVPQPEAEITPEVVVAPAPVEALVEEQPQAEVTPVVAAAPVEETVTPSAPTDEAAQTTEEETLEDLFGLQPEGLEIVSEDEEEGEEGSDKKGKKGKKGKKKGFVEIEYDPDHDVTIAKKKRKRGEAWTEEW
jgi:transcription termination/antitermination protein NusA